MWTSSHKWMHKFRLWKINYIVFLADTQCLASYLFGNCMAQQARVTHQSVFWDSTSQYSTPFVSVAIRGYPKVNVFELCECFDGWLSEIVLVTAVIPFSRHSLCLHDSNIVQTIWRLMKGSLTSVQVLWCDSASKLSKLLAHMKVAQQQFLYSCFHDGRCTFIVKNFVRQFGSMLR